MKRFGLLVMALAIVLFVPACGVQQRAAETAITSAEEALNGVKEEAMKVAPDEVKALEDAIASARASVEAGDYKAAIDTTQGIPAQVQELSAGLEDKAAQLQSQWDALNTALPGAVADLEKQVGRMRRPPSGMDAAAWDNLKTSLADAKAKWGEAQTAMGGGMMAEAVTKANEVKATVVDAMTALKMKVPETLQPAA